MDNHQNPWQTEASQGSPQRTNTSFQTQSNQPSSQGWSNPNTSLRHEDNISGSHNPWETQASSNPPQAQFRPQQEQYQAPPNPPPRRTDTEIAAILAAQPDSGEQLEHMQHYEASKTMTEDERNQADLQRQFPGIDSSLIAAIYSDHKDQRGGRVDLGSIRETLQELQS